MPGDSKKRSPLTPEKHKAIVVGVTDLRVLYQSPPQTMPTSEVTVRLHHGGTTLSPTSILHMPGPRVSARFEAVAPGSYQATAFRRSGSALVATALPKSVTLGQNQAQAAINLDLHHPPLLKLVEARFIGDHGVISETPVEPKKYTRSHPHVRIIYSHWGDGEGASVKPEYRASWAPNNPAGKASTLWDAASYSKGQTVALELKLQASVPDQRPHTLDSFRIKGGADEITFAATTATQLLDGATFELQLQAQASLPEHVEVFDAQLVMTASADQHPVRIERASHRVEVFVTLDKPGGQTEMHAKEGPGEVCPESGTTQTITAERLRRAVKGARLTSGDEQAMRQLFVFLRIEGIAYFPPFSYPPSDEDVDDDDNKTGFDPMPPLHEFLWLAMAEQQITHCLDLAAGFRLLARILGVKGAMDVKQCFPWPPWDNSGERRDLDKEGEPWQASMTKYPIADKSKVVFLDAAGYTNIFEAVLRYRPPGSQKAMLLPIGEERIIDDYGPGVTPGPADERNASLFFQASKGDRWQGKYPLLVKRTGDGSGYRKPPFPFMTHQQQVRFKFHYHKDTIEPDDELEP